MEFTVDDRDHDDLFDPDAVDAVSEPVQKIDLPIGKQKFEDLSGTAGTGKTFTAKQLIEQEPYGSVLLCATTGIAAVNLGEGTTINAALKYFNTQSLREAWLTGILQSVLRKHRRAGVRRILIDEKSMLGGEQLTYIKRAVDDVNKPKDMNLEIPDGADDPALYDDELPPPTDDPADQIGITLVGDFGQLPPIPDEDPATGKKAPLQFAFDSPEWGAFAEHRTQLTKIWRQDAQDFIQALQAIRKGNVVQALAFFGPNRFSATTDDMFNGTTIFAKNDAVERYNLDRLSKLTGTPMSFTTIRVGKQRPDWVQKPTGAGIPDVLTLKEGALVMILANRRQYMDEEDSTGRIIYANGDLGTIEGQSNEGWHVRLQRTKEIVKVLPIIRENTIPLEPGRKKELQQLFPMAWTEKLTKDKKSEIVGTVTYMPLRAAYACTVHKTQGLTLDNVQINLRDPFFRMPGMLFVALSRARTAQGLRIIGDQRGFAERCKIEPRVQPWL